MQTAPDLKEEEVEKPERGFVRNTFSSLSIRNYRLYFIGQGISMCGTWMQLIGQAWLVLQLTESGLWLGLVSAMQYLPILFLAPWGGVVADRFDKRRLLFFTQSFSAFFALVLAVLVNTGVVRLWMVIVLAALLGFTNAIDNPARQAFVHELVGPDELRNAVTLNSTLVNITRVIGPAIAGIVIATVGLATCFYLNAASFLAIIFCLYLMRVGELLTVPPVPRGKGQLREGFAYAWRTPVLRDALVMMALIGTFTYEFSISLPLIAKYTFANGAGGLAYLTTFMGAGAVLGGLVTAGRRKTAPRGLIWTAFAFGGSVLLTALSPDFVLAVAAMVLVGFCSVIFVALCNSILQLESDPNMRGRVMSLWSVAFFGSTAIGGPIIGFIGGHASPRWALVAGAIAAIGAGIYGLLAMRTCPCQEIPDGVVLEKPLPAEEDGQVL